MKKTELSEKSLESVKVVPLNEKVHHASGETSGEIQKIFDILSIALKNEDRRYPNFNLKNVDFILYSYPKTKGKSNIDEWKTPEEDNEKKSDLRFFLHIFYFGSRMFVFVHAASNVNANDDIMMDRIVQIGKRVQLDDSYDQKDNNISTIKFTSKELCSPTNSCCDEIDMFGNFGDEMSRTHESIDSVDSSESNVFGILRSWASTIKTIFSFTEEDRDFFSEQANIKVIERDIHLLETLFEGRCKWFSGSKMISSKDDFLSGEVYVDEKTKEFAFSKFLDVMKTDQNYRAFKLANVLQFCDGFLDNYLDFNLDSHVFRRFLKHYLIHFHLKTDRKPYKPTNKYLQEESEMLVEDLKPWFIVLDLFWGMWALIQSKGYSDEEKQSIYYYNYGKQKLLNYIKKRNKLFEILELKELIQKPLYISMENEKKLLTYADELFSDSDWDDLTQMLNFIKTRRKKPMGGLIYTENIDAKRNEGKEQHDFKSLLSKTNDLNDCINKKPLDFYQALDHNLQKSALAEVFPEGYNFKLLDYSVNENDKENQAGFGRHFLLIIFVGILLLCLWKKNDDPNLVQIFIVLFFVFIYLTHLILSYGKWFIITISSTDSVNTRVHRSYIVKPANHGRFTLSGYPDSISSSVSARGTTLNKIMIAICFSTSSMLIYDKFSARPSEIGKYYGALSLLLTFAGIYENHKYDYFPSKGVVRSTGGYKIFHSVTMVLFVFCTNAITILNCYSNLVYIICATCAVVTGLGFGLQFLWTDKLLMVKNQYISLGIIFLEMSCLLLTLFPAIWYDGSCQLT